MCPSLPVMGECFQVSLPVHPHAMPALGMNELGMCCRLGSGAFVSGKLSEFRKRPKEPIILYEFDGCPFCRKVGLLASWFTTFHAI